MMAVEEGMDWLKIIILFVIGLAIIMALAPRLVSTIKSAMPP